MTDDTTGTDETADAAIGAAVSSARGTLTQADLAGQMAARGWPWRQATVWSVEKGKRPLRLAEAADLAEILGVHLGRLLERPDTSEHRRELSAADRDVRQAHTAVLRASEDLLEQLDTLDAALNTAKAQKDPGLKLAISSASTSLKLTPEHAVRAARSAYDGAQAGA